MPALLSNMFVDKVNEGPEKYRDVELKQSEGLWDMVKDWCN